MRLRKEQVVVALISAGAKTIADTGTIETRIEYQVALRGGLHTVACCPTHC